MSHKQQATGKASVSVSKQSTKIDVSSIAFLLCTIIAISTVIFTIGFIFYTAMPTFLQQGIGFITGTTWNYDQHIYGILILIIDTIILTGLTIAIACPFSIFAAIFLAEYSPKWMASVLRPMIELLVGIPSVVYGIFGLYIMSSFFRDNINPFINSILGFIPMFRSPDSYTGGIGMLLASTILSIMILPTITSLSIEAITAVPSEYKEASIAIGATKWETTKKVVLPVASSGIIMAIILGVMRAMGETMAVVMLLGNQLHVSGSILDTGYAMTSKILNDIPFWVADDEARSALFGIAAVLIFMELIVIAASRLIGGKKII